MISQIGLVLHCCRGFCCCCCCCCSSSSSSASIDYLVAAEGDNKLEALKHMPGFKRKNCKSYKRITANPSCQCCFRPCCMWKEVENKLWISFQSQSFKPESLELDHSTAAAAAAAAMNESKSLMIDLLQNKPENQLEHHSCVAMNE